MFLSIDEDFSSDLLFVSSKRVSCVVFDPQNHNILASCSWDETVKIWDITAQRTLVRVHEVDEGEKKNEKKDDGGLFRGALGYPVPRVCGQQNHGRSSKRGRAAPPRGVPDCRWVMDLNQDQQGSGVRSDSE